MLLQCVLINDDLGQRFPQLRDVIKPASHPGETLLASTFVVGNAVIVSAYALTILIRLPAVMLGLLIVQAVRAAAPTKADLLDAGGPAQRRL